VGYELFDQNRLGISEFQEKLNYRRALQGELERTIGRLEPVQQARVHIALPEKQLFASQQEQPSASVILQLRSGSPLGQSEVSAIRHLVSSSVEGLPQQNVTVVDTNGRLLTEGDLSAGAAAGGLTSRLRYEADVEQQVARELQALLDRALGPGKSVVQVSADIDFDQRQVQEETYTPDNDGRGVLETRRENREVYRGSARTGGPPGLSAFRTQPAADPQAAKPPADDYERTESDIRYRVSKRLNTQTTTPGRVRRLSVAIFVDEQVPSEHAAAIQKTVAAAAGLNESRGDTIVMQRIPFPQMEPESAPLTIASRLTNWLGASARPVVAVGLLLCFLVLARMFLRTNPVVAVTAAPPAQAGKALDVASGAPALPAGEVTPEGGSDMDLDRAASVVRAWLSTGESS
jgi:flagellar M-ring protein FliF